MEGTALAIEEPMNRILGKLHKVWRVIVARELRAG